MSDDDSTPPAGFRKIPGFPRYAIDENGTVLSICRYGGRDAPWSEAKRLRTYANTDGYLFVGLCRDGKVHWKRIHALVLSSFVCPRPAGMQTRHLDGDKKNNHVSNLQWGTGSQNYSDMVVHGTASRGEKCGASKLKSSDVLEIRQRYANGESLRVLANEFHVTKGSVWFIVTRRNWKHI